MWGRVFFGGMFLGVVGEGGEFQKDIDKMPKVILFYPRKANCCGVFKCDS